MEGSAARLAGEHGSGDCDNDWHMHQRPQGNADLHTTILLLHFWHFQCFMLSCYLTTSAACTPNPTKRRKMSEVVMQGVQ